MAFAGFLHPRRLRDVPPLTARRQHTLALEFEHRFLNGLQWITALLSLQSRTTSPEAAEQLAIAAC
jgi:two-component sensor histidine kinase